MNASPMNWLSSSDLRVYELPGVLLWIMALTHLMKQFTTMKMNFTRAIGMGNGPMIMMLHMSKGMGLLIPVSLVDRFL